MSGRPVFVGAVQLTSRLVVLPKVPVTVGSDGARGASVVLSSTLNVTSMVPTPPLSSLALTVTE